MDIVAVPMHWFSSNKSRRKKSITDPKYVNLGEKALNISENVYVAVRQDAA